MKLIYLFILGCAESSLQHALSLVVSRGYVAVRGMLIAMASLVVITLPTKVRLVKAMVFPVVMYGCESWTVKKA